MRVVGAFSGQHTNALDRARRKGAHCSTSTTDGQTPCYGRSDSAVRPPVQAVRLPTTARDPVRVGAPWVVLGSAGHLEQELLAAVVLPGYNLATVKAHLQCKSTNSSKCKTPQAKQCGDADQPAPLGERSTTWVTPFQSLTTSSPELRSVELAKRPMLIDHRTKQAPHGARRREAAEHGRGERSTRDRLGCSKLLLMRRRVVVVVVSSSWCRHWGRFGCYGQAARGGGRAAQATGTFREPVTSQAHLAAAAALLPLRFPNHPQSLKLRGIDRQARTPRQPLRTGAARRCDRGASQMRSVRRATTWHGHGNATMGSGSDGAGERTGLSLRVQRQERAREHGGEPVDSKRWRGRLAPTRAPGRRLAALREQKDFVVGESEPGSASKRSSNASDNRKISSLVSVGVICDAKLSAHEVLSDPCVDTQSPGLSVPRPEKRQISTSLQQQHLLGSPCSVCRLAPDAFVLSIIDKKFSAAGRGEDEDVAALFRDGSAGVGAAVSFSFT
nr:unnamed protein product [Digitaria exilis]